MKSGLSKLANLTNVKPSVCLNKDSGQVFDDKGNPTKEIYRHNYSDASKRSGHLLIGYIKRMSLSSK